LQALRSNYQVVVIGLHHFAKYPANNFGISAAAIRLADSIQHLLPSITLVFGNPYAIANVAGAPNLVACYEDDAIFQKAAFDFLEANIFAKGTLPVTVGAFKYGSGITTNASLPLVDPASVGLNADTLQKIDSLAMDAIQQHATPGCVVLAARNGKVAFYKSYGFMNYDKNEPMGLNAVFDLASVTKITATLVSVMKLYEEGKLDITKTIGDYLPWVRGTDKSNLILYDVLLHQARLKAFIPFYKETIDTVTGIPKPGYYQSLRDDVYSVKVADNMYMRRDYVDTMYARILQSELGNPHTYVYSDNDFIF